ncbi:Metallo-dependent phosphatase-like protein [Lentinula aff. detonsa]|uniref:Sphingomyelin phosphodiesterase n=1 Tax=Lentinula aff. detonsa TaxID=2804958 RepID=A0AA38KY15_9AGAR|nr:Metallo-dependent phosphatase-like protein [Lentinula aff. detonsa]
MLWQRLLPQLLVAALLTFPYTILALHGSTLADDIITGLNSATDCASCHSLLLTFKATAALGDQALVNSLKGICKRLQLQDTDVCDGVFESVGPLLAHDLRSISPFGQTSTKFCTAMLGLCRDPPVNNYTVPFPKSAPENPTAFKSSGKPPFRVAHFSDIHIDREYTVGSEANCSKPLCCREFSDQSEPTTIPAGPHGDHACDTPSTLVESIVKAIDATNNTFSIFTGDIVDGAVWLVNQEDVTADINLFGEEFRMALKTPVYPALGNHESAPVNCFPRLTTEDHANDSQWVFETSSAQWLPWIGQAAADQIVHHSGSYSLLVPNTTLRMISINSGFWYKMNLWLYDSDDQQPDPNGILSFLISQLQIAEDLGQRCWIIAHMPPGGGDVLLDQSNYYAQVIHRYRNTITGQFYGHTHADEFQLSYSNYSDQSRDTATSMAFIAPALTPRSGNPAFKVYDVDPDTYEIIDSKTYSTDLSHPEYQVDPVWKMTYSARDLYGSSIPGGLDPSASLSPSFWHQVTELFETDNKAFRTFQHLKRRTGGGGCSSHDDDDEAFIECKRRSICQLRAQRSENNCADVRRGWFWEGNEPVDVESSISESECEGVGIGSIFKQMVRGDKMDQSTKRSLRAHLNDILLPAQEHQGNVQSKHPFFASEMQAVLEVP